MEEFKTIDNFAIGEIEEKRSKFIANVFYIENEEQAKNYIKEIKKKHHAAKHNCFAYKLIKDSKLIERSSDDGEPSGTAGMPILNVIETKGLCNILVIVTRYFGGILLGTGGLIRCYTYSTKTALENAIIKKKIIGYEVQLLVPYEKIEKIEYYARINKLKILRKTYTEKIEIIVELPQRLKQDFLSLDIIKQIEPENCKFSKEKFVDK